MHSLNQPREEEEESSKEKECDNDIYELSYESNFFVSGLQSSANLVWHITKINFYSYTSDIFIPPPKA